MNAETQQRLITLLAAGIAFGMSHAVANRFIDIPEHGNEDDVLESVLKGGTTAVSTLLATIIVRQVFPR